jgi:hypothetical protein
LKIKSESFLWRAKLLSPSAVGLVHNHPPCPSGFYLSPVDLLAMRNISEWSIRNPMAVAVVGGLITSTALTLVVIPVVFTCFDDLQTELSRIFQSKLRTSDAIPAQE